MPPEGDVYTIDKDKTSRPRKSSVDKALVDVFLKAYRMYQKMVPYPHLQEEIRTLFLSVLAEEGIITLEDIRREAVRKLREEGLPVNDRNIRDYSHALIDFHFARHFTQEEIENYIHLARKQDAFQNLTKVLNTEGVTFKAIRQVLKEFCEIPQGSLYISPNEAEGVRVALISHFISDQLPFVGVAKKYITIRDVDEMLDHSTWNPRRSGRVGGKAAGMFLAYRIILPRLETRDPDIEHYVRIPESYYFSSGMLSDFIDYNRLYSFHSQKYKSIDTIGAEYGKIAQLVERASFPPDIIEDFKEILGGVGEYPLILRSSSLLEDNFGYSFSGKYDSVFIANQGDLQTRLAEFIRGMKRVFMSVFNPGAIYYRRDHNLLDFDEQMSVLVQKVVGRRFGNRFFPFAGGVAFSHNGYAWTPRIIKEEGVVRLVLGLGTRAVDRVEPDYPRLIPLSHPSLRPEVTIEQIRKYSQKMVDVLNLETSSVETVPYIDLLRGIDHPDLFYALSLGEGGHLAPPLFKGQEISLDRSCLTFDNFLTKTPFVPLMKKVLKKLETAYGRPVDVEFAWDNDILYLLQCRSLAMTEHIGKVIVPKSIPADRILFTNNRGIFNGMIRDIEYIIYVDPKAYARLTTYEERTAVGHAVSRINRILESRRIGLLGPTRWGSNDIKYGVKVGYEDINHTLILGEVAFEEGGSAPDVSYGTHFFNDLVEARIVPLAIYPDEPDVIFKEEFFLEPPNLLGPLAPDLAACAPVVHVIHVPSRTGGRLLQVYQDSQGQQGMGFFATPDEHREEASSRLIDESLVSSDMG